MSPETNVPAPSERITLDDLKNRATKVKELATSEAKVAVKRAVDTSEARTLFVMVGVAVVVASVAFYLGARSAGCRSGEM